MSTTIIGQSLLTVELVVVKLYDCVSFTSMFKSIISVTSKRLAFTVSEKVKMSSPVFMFKSYETRSGLVLSFVNTFTLNASVLLISTASFPFISLIANDVIDKYVLLSLVAK